MKLRGFRIELGEVENVLAQCRHVQLAVAQLCNDAAGTPHLVAYVTPLEVSIDACKAEMQASVPGASAPAPQLCAAPLEWPSLHTPPGVLRGQADIAGCHFGKSIAFHGITLVKPLPFMTSRLMRSEMEKQHA